MKIAHVSDLHICVRHKLQNIERTERLIEFAHQQNVDHLIVSGDISQNSHVEDFEIFRQILNKYDFLTPQKTSVVVGNHDVYGGVHLAEDIITFPTKCANINLREQVNRFTSFFHETFSNVIQKSKDVLFPYIKVLDGLVLIGIDSTHEYSKLKNFAASNGKIDSEDYEFLNDVLSQNKFKHKKKLVTLHHHVAENMHKFENKIWKGFEGYTMRLKGKNRFIKFLKNNKIDLVLHGHVHQNYKYEHKGIHFLNGGASTENDLDNEMKINLIELFNHKIKISINSLVEVEQPKEEVFPMQPYPLIPSFA